MKEKKTGSINSLLVSISIVIAGIILRSGTVYASQDIELKMNELKTFPVNKIERVAVGEPQIADITVLNTNELMLIGKRAGMTSLIVWDASGQRSFNIVVIEKDFKKNAQEAERKIRAIFKNLNIYGIKIKLEEDKVYVIGEVLNKDELDKVESALKPFLSLTEVVNLVKIKARQPLVEIDVNVLEISLDDIKKLGMVWTNLLPITYTEADTGSSLPKFWKVFDWDRTTIDARLNFLVGEDKARTLANPKLVALSGKEATFLVGGEVPYVTVESEGKTSVEWKNYGVDLEILPEVNNKNEIKLRVKANISDLDWGNAVTQQGYSIPAIKKREVKTELILYEGDTIFLAGLIKNEDSNNVERLPWLTKLPILGELFKSTEFRDKRTELVISLRPKIIGGRIEENDNMINDMLNADEPAVPDL
ncbi:MAG: pilus assembly protein N-terminal domain-containing protein [Candidatus Omnitrophota bacterium]